MALPLKKFITTRKKDTFNVAISYYHILLLQEGKKSYSNADVCFVLEEETTPPCRSPGVDLSPWNGALLTFWSI